MSKDFYEVLDVRRDASQDTIEDAYRSLTRKWHPDRNPDAGAETMMKEINQAYRTLRSEGVRHDYDNGRHPESPAREEAPYHDDSYAPGAAVNKRPVMTYAQAMALRAQGKLMRATLTDAGYVMP